MALGLTSYLPVDERHTLSKEYLETKLVHIMGGRVAEKIKFNQLTTGAGNDLEQAAKIARKMVCDWGMSEKIGPLALGKKDDEIFLGRDFARQRDYSEATAIQIDSEIREIVLKAEKSATELLTANVKKLDKLAKALLEKEILDGAEIDEILRQFGEEERLESNGEAVNPGGSGLARIDGELHG
jgi:cell division protease FtsH